MQLNLCKHHLPFNLWLHAAQLRYVPVNAEAGESEMSQHGLDHGMMPPPGTMYNELTLVSGFGIIAESLADYMFTIVYSVSG